MKLNKIIENIIILLIFSLGYFRFFLSDLPVFGGYFNTIDGSLYFTRIFDLAISMAIFISVSQYWIPRLVNMRNIWRLAFLSLALVLGLSLLEWGLDYLVLNLFNLPTEPGQFSDKMLIYRNYKSINLAILPSNLALYLVAAIYGFARDWARQNRLRLETEKEKLQADNLFLRAQLNPHFFFNALNNIFSITQKNKDDEAGRAILQLSDIMRYMVYDSNVDKISLAQEIALIRQYLKLAELRFEPDDPYDIDLNFDPAMDNYQLPPLLFFPFVENAVKFGFDSKGSGYLRVYLKEDVDKIAFSIVNSKNNLIPGNNEAKGVGMINMKKRLRLLFPHSHTLSVSETEELYEVRLEVGLTPEMRDR